MKILAFRNLSHRRRSFVVAFSLVEITIAMGIVASVLIALLALLPFAMDSIREAKNTQVMARVSNEVVTNLQEMEWGLPPAYNLIQQMDGQVFYFDQEGTPLLQAGADAAYQAQITVADAKAFLLPGGAPSSGGVNRQRRQVTIKVAFAPPGRPVNFAQTTAPLPYRVFNTMIANLGRDR